MEGSDMSGLRLDGLAVGYGNPLISQMELHVCPGEVVAVLGPSGCGKSTLLGTIVGTIPAIAGRIWLDGRDITDLAIHERRVGIVFQEPLLFGHLDVLANVAYGPRRRGATRHQSMQQAGELLEWVGLADLAHRPISQLSGGQAQRVALARALAAEPAAIMLDEPFSALDADLRARLAGEVAGWLRARGISTLHVTHDVDEAVAIADRVFVMQQGEPGSLRGLSPQEERGQAPTGDGQPDKSQDDEVQDAHGQADAEVSEP